MPRSASSLLDLAGLALLTVAALIVTVPLGLAVAGVACLAVSRAMTRGGGS